jgi:hypothetical protein
MSGIEKIYEITLDIKKETEKPYIEFVQGDTLNKIIITILNDNKPVMLSNYTYIIVLKRPDNVLIQSIPYIADNKLIYDVGTTEILVSGLVKCSIEIFDGQERITIKTFNFVAVASLRDNDINNSETDYPITYMDYSVVWKGILSELDDTGFATLITYKRVNGRTYMQIKFTRLVDGVYTKYKITYFERDGVTVKSENIYDIPVGSLAKG